MADTTVIRKCDCKHEYQDTHYGNGMRVCNPTMKGKGGTPVYRCTVCAKEQN